MCSNDYSRIRCIQLCRWHTLAVKCGAVLTPSRATTVENFSMCCATVANLSVRCMKGFADIDPLRPQSQVILCSKDSSRICCIQLCRWHTLAVKCGAVSTPISGYDSCKPLNMLHERFHRHRPPTPMISGCLVFQFVAFTPAGSTHWR